MIRWLLRGAFIGWVQVEGCCPPVMSWFDNRWQLCSSSLWLVKVAAVLHGDQLGQGDPGYYCRTLFCWVRQGGGGADGNYLHIVLNP